MIFNPKTADITIPQGATFLLEIEAKQPNDAIYDLTGYEARMQIRPRHSSSRILLDLETGSGITITPQEGKIEIRATPAMTTTLPAMQAVYDLFVVAGNGTTSRLLEGKATITPRVTRL